MRKISLLALCFLPLYLNSSIFFVRNAEYLSSSLSEVSKEETCSFNTGSGLIELPNKALLNKTIVSTKLHIIGLLSKKKRTLSSTHPFHQIDDGQIDDGQFSRCPHQIDNGHYFGVHFYEDVIVAQQGAEEIIWYKLDINKMITFLNTPGS